VDVDVLDAADDVVINCVQSVALSSTLTSLVLLTYSSPGLRYSGDTVAHRDSDKWCSVITRPDSKNLRPIRRRSDVT